MTFRDFIFTLLYRGLEHFGKFYSAYRGYVVDNNDPEKLHRIKVRIPVVTKEKTHTKWIFPKNLYGGKDHGIQLLPEIGDLVWVEFEHGNTEFPIWSHGHYGIGEKPVEFVNSKVYGFKSPKGQLVVIDDRPNENYIRIKDANNTDKVYKTELIAFNHGENGGLVKVVELTKRLNALENKLNAVLKHYDSHVHIDPLSGYTGTPSPPLAEADFVTPRPINIGLTDQSTIENEKILH